jgi:hypothetical protein
MNIEHFISLLKECKQSLKNTGNLNILCKTWDRKKAWLIHLMEDKKCKTCGHTTHAETDGVYLYFKEPKEHLTIFEAHLMYMMFKQKLKPYDYAGWHECIAGKNFIENIDSIQFNEGVAR